MQPLCKVIGTLLLSVLLPWPSTGQFHVIGPKEPIIAKAGEDAVLSCHLNPVMNAQNMEVKWYRNHSSALVHCYGASQDHKEQQMPEYQGRTGFLKENITKGQASLRIHSIRPSDGGEYSCFFESSTYYDDSIFEVLVTGSGAAPHIHVEPGNTRKVKLTCTSTGWYPEPEVQWRDLKGQLVVPDAETKTTEANGLFHVETFVTVDKSSSGAVSCLVRNPILNEEKEVYISVADTSSPYPWIIGFAVLLSLLAVVITVSAVYVVRARKAKEWSLAKDKEEIKEEKEHIENLCEHIKKLIEHIETFNENLQREKRSLQQQNENLQREKQIPMEASARSASSNLSLKSTHSSSRNYMNFQEHSSAPSSATRISGTGTNHNLANAEFHTKVKKFNNPPKTVPDSMPRHRALESKVTSQVPLPIPVTLSQNENLRSSVSRQKSQNNVYPYR